MQKYENNQKNHPRNGIRFEDKRKKFILDFRLLPK